MRNRAFSAFFEDSNDDKSTLHFFAANLLAKAISCYLMFPYVSKILSQDKKICQIFDEIEICIQMFIVGWITSSGTVKLNFGNGSKIVPFNQQFGEILWNFFILQ